MNPTTQITPNLPPLSRGRLRGGLTELASAIAVESRWIVPDTAMMTWRNLMRYVRNREFLGTNIAGPVMFVLLFTYTFGGAISTGEIAYVDFLIPGILIQNSVFNAMQTGVGLADDLQKGIVDRYRSLPMARSAVLGGRVVSTAIFAFLTAIWTLAIAVAIGMRFHGDLVPAILLPFAIAAFSFGFCWVAAFVGAIARSAEAVGSATFIIALPLSFLSSAYVPVETMPGWLQVFAEVNPVTHAVNLARALAQGGPLISNASITAFWITVMICVFAPIATWRYSRV